MNHEVNRLVQILVTCLLLVSSVVMPCVFCLNWPVLFLLAGPLRAVVVLLLVGLTWLLANTLFGGDSGSTVRHFFSGKRSTSETKKAEVENNQNNKNGPHSLVIAAKCEDLGSFL